MENSRPAPRRGNTRDKEGRSNPGESAGSRERRAGSRERGAGSRERGAGSRERGAGSGERWAASRKPAGKTNSRDKVVRGSKKPATQDSVAIRLNRLIANSGVCSRRDADEYIRDGHVTVNGKVVTDMGVKVSLSDDVRFKNKRLSAERKVYIVMNKPKDYVTTVEDPHADKTVLDLLGNAVPERVYPVGRLDKSTTGILILTNDGELAGKLTHPKYKRRKIYHVFLDKPVTKNDLVKLAEGVELEDATVAADAVSFADPEDKTQIGIELHSGQNRVVRRMFETLGYRVRKLDRVYFAGLTKKNLPRGKWRFLTEKEIGMLKRGIF